MGVFLDLDRHGEPSTAGADVSSSVSGVMALGDWVHVVRQTELQVRQECVSTGVLRLGCGQVVNRVCLFGFSLRTAFPVTVITVALYQDDQGRRFVAVEGEHEPESAGPTSRPDREEYWKVGGRRILVTDLLDHGLLEAGERLVWDRPRLDEHYEAWI